MRSIRTLMMASALSLAAAPAFAQLYPGDGVTVDPSAIGAAPYHVGEKPIHLRKPGTHVVHHAKHTTSTAAAATPAPAAPAPATQTASAPAAPVAAPPAAAPKHKARKQAVASTPPAPAAQAPAPTDDAAAMGGAIPFSMDGQTPVASPKAERKQAARAPAPSNQTVASTEPPPAATAPSPAKQAASDAGLSKRGEILFNKASTDPAPAQMDGLKLLAGDLSTALKQGATRIQLQAYGGNHGDKGSEARRLSLKRALSIRQVLIDNGVPAGDIDVRAMGGADDKGPTDRVDVYIRAG